MKTGTASIGAKPKAAAAAVKKTPTKAAPKKVATNGQTQDKGADSGKQGDNSTMNELRGGTKQVLITEATMSPRGGAPSQPEEYPFSALEPARKTPNGIAGPSFFIPSTDKPEAKLSTARKRHKGVKFWSRNVEEEINGQLTQGMRVWRAPAGEAATVA